MISARTVLLLTLIFSVGVTAVKAEWTGISVDINEISTELQFETGQRAMRLDNLSLKIEEKTAANLRVGLSIGQISTRTANQLPPDNAQKFEGNYLGLYLRLPIQAGEHFSINGKFSYRYNYATEAVSSLPSELEWHDRRFQIGLGAKFQALRVTPFIVYHRMSGDITNATGTELFDSINSVSRGISIDYFIEPTAYIRFQLSRGGEEGGYLRFARVY